MHKVLEGHTVKRFDGELGHLHYLILEMGGLVLDQVRTSLHALVDEDTGAARQVLEREMRVTELGLRVDEELVKVIAKRGPVARDLRAVVSFSKAVSDLERIDENAQRIAQAALSMYESGSNVPSSALLRDVTIMGALGVEKLEEGLDVLDTLPVEGPFHPESLHPVTDVPGDPGTGELQGDFGTRCDVINKNEFVP